MPLTTASTVIVPLTGITAQVSIVPIVPGAQWLPAAGGTGDPAQATVLFPVVSMSIAVKAISSPAAVEVLAGAIAKARIARAPRAVQTQRSAVNRLFIRVPLLWVGF
jgi:hypothetical protein